MINPDYYDYDSRETLYSYDAHSDRPYMTDEKFFYVKDLLKDVVSHIYSNKKEIDLVNLEGAFEEILCEFNISQPEIPMQIGRKINTLQS